MTIVSSFEIIAEYLVPKLPKPLPSNLIRPGFPREPAGMGF